MFYEPPVTFIDRARRRFARLVKVRPHKLVNRDPLVSFTFDDFPRSSAQIGSKVLEAYGARGTFYVCAGIIGTRDASGEYATFDDLVEIAARGHELACHTYGHRDGLRLSAADMAEDIERNARALARHIGNYPLENFAYPYGRFCHNLQVEIASRFQSGRGVLPGINHGIVDLTHLYSGLLYGTPAYQAEAHRLIEDNARLGGWLIFLTHDVGRNPSPYGCTAEQLDLAARAALRTGAEIVTVSAALRRVGAVRTCR